MKKLIILMLFILLFGYCYADNNYYIIHFYKPYGRSPTDTLEYLFYDDGLIKQITYYDLREECDYYNWEKIKKNLKILRQYKINRSDKVINSVLIENNSETIEKRIEKKDDGTFIIDYKSRFSPETLTYTVNFKKYENLISNNYMHFVNEESYLMDNTILAMIDIPSNKKFLPEKQKLVFDGKNVYRITTNHPYGEDTTTVTFISDYIPFTYENAVLNFELNNMTSMPVTFCSVPTIPPSSALYKDYQNSTKTLLWERDKKTIKLNSNLYNLIDTDFGLEKYTDKNNTELLLLKNENIAILYDKEESVSSFTGIKNNNKILPIDKIKSSSFLKEGKIEYSAENLKFLKLKNPWVEGVKGDGIGEYIQFNKKDASGLFMLNGFISLNRSDLYEKNNRVEKITISGMTSKAKKEVLLLDTAKPQYIDLSDFSNNEEIKLVIQSVYKGSKYDDTCIAGIILMQ